MKCGDIVRLKSGGPSMTIASSQSTPDGEVLIRCCWFDEKSEEVNYHDFREGMLTTDLAGGGEEVRVIIDEGWYGNDAHERQAARDRDANSAAARDG
ncbi:MAG TPA: DUF2158 domain-containing protein [Pirellulales bacterium]|jgi:uncharacterized protein YodC (DUF2158 family)|nr:DUF2158 domain-containing protein [Pirellulales bacterium]